MASMSSFVEFFSKSKKVGNNKNVGATLLLLLFMFVLILTCVILLNFPL